MENPHEEKQAVYLERIIKNAVSNPAFFVRKVFQPVLTPLNTKDKCLEAIKELNASIEVWLSFLSRQYPLRSFLLTPFLGKGHLRVKP